jgi:SAM-dependent methyltransferase
MLIFDIPDSRSMTGVQPPDVQRSQAVSLRDWHRYLIDRFSGGSRTALEVGCGEGFVMSNLSDLLEVKGVDLDKEQATKARKRGLDVEAMDGLDLLFDDGSFDLVYCSFYLMWANDQRRAIGEMLRVSRKGILVLNEPVWSRSLCGPDGIEDLVDGWTNVIRKDGGDPDAGLKVARLVGEMGGRFGTVPVEMNRVELERNVEFEYTHLETRGLVLNHVKPIMFHVPFLWGFAPRCALHEEIMSSSL